MRIKFNKFERVAGLFVLSVILGGLFIVAGVAVKQGWFEAKVTFRTTFTNADGVHSGTAVQMSGLRAGSVTEVELRSNNKIHVTFEISEKFADLVRQDSVVRLLRPFVISEKAIDISVGNMQLERSKAGSELKSEATTDLMDLVSGKTLMPYLETMGKMFENLRVVAEHVLDPSRTKDLVHMFDSIAPLLGNMNSMSREVTSLIKDTNKNKRLVQIVENLHAMTNEVNKVLPALAAMAPTLIRESPKVASDLQKIAANMAVLSEEIGRTLPAIKTALQELGPDIPRATKRAMEALDETVVTLKALQKSFILRGNTEEVRKEEALRMKESGRAPANKSEKPKDEEQAK